MQEIPRIDDAKLVWLSTPRHACVKLTAALPARAGAVESVVLASRQEATGLEYPLPFSVRSEAGSTLVDVAIEPHGLHLEGALWDLFIRVSGPDGAHAFCQVRINRDFRRWAKLRGFQCDAGAGFIFFPYTAAASRLAFTYRKASVADTRFFRVKELAAIALAKAGAPYWRKRNIWLVFEKYCSYAQDNGFAFFRYCMDEAPVGGPQVFYVIDRTAPDAEKLAPYAANTIDFLSFKHLLYALVARMYVGSDSTAHLFQWRPRPSMVWSRIRKHRIFFLQHGVTALKQVENLFGTQGANPMTYFLTTSHREQEIVTEHLGYDEAHAPVLGFSRWDLLRNTGDVQAPVILVMPTWRPWLEELSSEAFRESRYFQAFSSLCANPRLEALLERANATVKFFIHPKLSEQLGAFAGGSPRVQFIDAGSMPLNELIMECAMLVTDYSSVCWDVLYLHKPVVFYQFDQDDYLREVGSYLDFDRELPGPVALDESACVDAIASVAESGFHMDDTSQRKAAPFQELDDTRNRERTYRFLTSHSL